MLAMGCDWVSAKVHVGAFVSADQLQQFLGKVVKWGQSQIGLPQQAPPSCKEPPYKKKRKEKKHNTKKNDKDVPSSSCVNKITSVDDDVIKVVLSFLDLKSFARAQASCRTFYHLGNEMGDSFWDRFIDYYIDKNDKSGDGKDSSMRPVGILTIDPSIQSLKKFAATMPEEDDDYYDYEYPIFIQALTMFLSEDLLFFLLYEGSTEGYGNDVMNVKGLLVSNRNAMHMESTVPGPHEAFLHDSSVFESDKLLALLDENVVQLFRDIDMPIRPALAQTLH